MREPRTLCELFQFSLADRPRERAYLYKKHGAYQPISSREFADGVGAVSSALRQIGVQPGDRVAILSTNRIEWAMADHAILHCGAITVPVYPTLPAKSVRHILRDCQAMAAFVADDAQLEKLGSRSDLPALLHAIVFDGGEREDTVNGRQVGSWREFETRGASKHDPEAFSRVWRALKPEAAATLIYTSGTTGVPKGVMLSHQNIVSNVLSVLHRFPIGPADTCLSFLPLSHVLERMAGHFVMWHVGACIAFAESIDTVPQNLLEVRPTVLVSVPRLYEKMYARVLDTVAESGALRRKLFFWAQRIGTRRVRLEQAGARVSLWLRAQHGLADKLVFARLRQRLGGRMRFMISGGAPLSAGIAEFFHAAKLLVLEGYGLTETSPVTNVNPVDRPRIGTVGPPIDGVQVRIGDDGEILVRGPNVMQGYFGKPEETEAALRDGWFHTGDMGRIDPDGYLVITDRLKDLIVTAGGKKVAPQPIEAQLKTSALVAEAVLVGDRRKYLTALIVPQFTYLQKQVPALGLTAAAPDALVHAPACLALFTGLVAEVNAQLAPFERIKRFRLLERELQLEQGEITPTMKVKRSEVARIYSALIDSMYQDPPPAGVGCPSTEVTPAESTPIPTPTDPIPSR
jgi:long-chain acyl-CoA synthetase